MRSEYLSLLLVVPGLLGTAHAHTIDSVEEYRVEIGWMNEPVVSGETNGIEFFVSPLEPGLEFEEQAFQNGVEGLRKDIKIQLVLKDSSIILPLTTDHSIPGKYYAFVTPTVPGFYQANILGNIHGTPISLSMHPPKVNDRTHIEFPEPLDLTLSMLNEDQDALAADVETLKQSVADMESDALAADVETLKQSVADMESVQTLGYAGIGLGIAGVAIATTALARSKK